MRKMLDNLFTGAVLFLLVTSAFLSYYLRPWRWMRFNHVNPAVPDDPFAMIPLPDANKKRSTQAENAVV